MANRPSAPVFPIGRRAIVAVEHPMIIKNVDNGIKSFGNKGPYVFKRILDSQHAEGSIPVYLRPDDPMCAPVLSYNVASSSVVLKITVPKRTGRKRKRGSQDPYTFSSDDFEQFDHDNSDAGGATEYVASRFGKDHPFRILRALKDNPGKFAVEAVAEVDYTHRFRGLSDFHVSTTHGKFMTNVRENMLSGDAEKMRLFKFDPSMGVVKDDEIIPPPFLTDHSLPFNWGYHQNPNLTLGVDSHTGQTSLIQINKPKKVETMYLPADCELVPQTPHLEPPTDNPYLMQLIGLMNQALEERPIWTRRAMLNHIRCGTGEMTAKVAFQYVGYQFRGGPWRDAIIRFGVDPRTDPQYRFYQTLFFQLYNQIERKPGQPWKDIRSEWSQYRQSEEEQTTHIFDGKTVAIDGKIWQLCDVTDPLLRQLIETPTISDKCDISSAGTGWFLNGTWWKIRGIMKTKIMAIRAQKPLADDMFYEALQVPDIVEVKNKRQVQIPLPDVRLTDEEIAELKAKGMEDILDSNGLLKKKSLRVKRKLRIIEARNRMGNPVRKIRRRRKSVGRESGVPSPSPSQGLQQSSTIDPAIGDDYLDAPGAVIGDEEELEEDEEDMEDILEGHDYWDDQEGLDDGDMDSGDEDLADDGDTGDAGFYHRQYELLKASYPGTI
ncbi:hypothetical protein BP5796_04501 [Coleophoma crateriformis]|uniref:Uncharacterized protein n=1 Tax=Coleophoma crateriformis TaxID=565419 RepID=A0A3D8S9S3_9HELO|nr:hypothetical protein BP5796_04501 [Coleophoma crateriformis]